MDNRQILTPEYLLAAANHAIPNGDLSVADSTPLISGPAGLVAGAVVGAELGSAAGPVGTVVGALVGAATGYDWRFTATAAISGVTQVTNSVASIANLIPGAHFEQTSIQDRITGLDDNLGQYYTEHQDAVDAAGFIAGSILPGLAGLKSYNMASLAIDRATQGLIGRNMGEATGLLVGTQKYHLAEAAATMETSGQAFSFLNQSIIRSIAAGAGEQALQGMAFEGGVQLMMNSSPLLSDQDHSDIAMNVLKAGMLGGALGGAFEAAKVGFSMKNYLGKVDSELNSNRWQRGNADGTPTDIKILSRVEDAENLATTATRPELAGVAAQTQVAAKNKMYDEVGQLFQTLAHDDAFVANAAHEIMRTEPDLLGASKVTLGLEELSRVGERTPLEKKIIEATTRQELGETLTAEELKLLDLSTKYIKVWGEGAAEGAVMPEKEGFTSLWDTLGKGQAIQVLKGAIKAGKQEFKIEPAKIFDIRSAKTVAEANARDVWAELTTTSLPDNTLIGAYDPALLRKAAKDLADPESGVTIVRVKDAEGEGFQTITNQADMHALLQENLRELQGQFLARSVLAKEGSAAKLGDTAIASMLNVKVDYMKNALVNVANPASDFHAIQSYAEEYATKLAGKVKPSLKDSILLHPQTVKAIYDTSRIDAFEATSLPFTVYMKQQQKLFQLTAARASATVTGQYDSMLPMPEELDMQRITRNAGGAGKFSSAAGKLGSEESKFERIGHVFNQMKAEVESKLAAMLDPVVWKLHGDIEASAEFGGIQSLVRSTPEMYVLDKANSRIVMKQVLDYENAIAAGEVGVQAPKIVDASAAESIPITNPKVLDILEQHIALRDTRLGKFNAIRSVSGVGDSREAGIVYFPPPDTKNYPFFALVTDPQITSTGHIKMLHAASSEKLEELLAKIPEEFQAGIIRAPKAKLKEDIERWHKAIGDYEVQETMSDSYFDAALHRSGAASPYLPKTDASVLIDELRNYHLAEEKLLLREAVSLRYSAQFEELKNLGDRDASIRLASFSSKSAGRYAKEQGDNPYLSHIRTALDLGNTEKIPSRTTQNYLDEQLSKAWDLATHTFKQSTSVEDLDKINSTWKALGIKTIDYDASVVALANHTYSRGALSTFTRRANAILTSTILKPSVLNAVNNTVGMVVMLSPEVHSLVEGIKLGDTGLAGQLADISHVGIPGTENSFLSTAKLIHQGMKDFMQPENRAWLLQQGFSVRHSQEVSGILDHLSLNGLGGDMDLNSRITMAYNKAMEYGKVAEKYTGNSYAEEFTRGTTAMIMKRLTDAVVAEGKMSQALADSYIQTTVNRVNGNYLASQRPMMFNGPVGQSVGLFQTYMVNMIQQTMRHMVEGSTKSVALMMAAQGTIYGMASLPGFQQLNTALVGNFAGNTDHKDLYYTAYNAMDKNMADWVMYGSLSNCLGFFSPALKNNMYVRGDINPRQVSIIPITPMDVPIAMAGAKFFGNLADTFNKIYIEGASPGTAFLRGLEHNGISRELSGLAQVLEAFTNSQGKSYSTDNAGKLIGANDFFSLMNLTRLSGAKPLDEAKALDASYRQVVYNAKEHDSIARLGEVLRTKLVGMESTDELSPEDVHKFMVEYVKMGGKQENFNRYMIKLQKEANTSKANQLIRHLGSPEGQAMQELMGGRPANDIGDE